MLTDLEAFAREWEAAERSRHARLLEQLKHEYRELSRASASVEQAIAPPYSVRLPRQ
ncbi:MAG: hypothetical protein HC895_22680 [Leptolyngbyaceae cyanobacterium SM1_3_5]|nr:hypothetical protein [Leptolyngbyaceae cyanobacterium SM1_3_5]